MDSPKPYYSRDELVAIIDEFYTFLTTFYIPASAVKRPSPEGWPNITPATTKGFRKSQAVIDLIKHLPYIDEKESKKMITNIHYKSDVLDYSVRTPEDFAENNMCIGEMGLVDKIEEIEADWAAYEEGDDDEEEVEELEDIREEEEDVEMGDAEGAGADDVPAESEDEDEDGNRGPWNEDPDEIVLENVIVLSQGYENGGRDIILDVVKGVIYEDVLGRSLQEGVEVKAFFKDLRDRYETLEMVPVPGHMYEDAPEIGDEELAEDPFAIADREKAGIEIQKRFKQIYREHGWPGESYKKEEALAAVKAFNLRVQEYESKFVEKSEGESEEKSEKE
jgi:hypothetical protein